MDAGTRPMEPDLRLQKTVESILDDLLTNVARHCVAAGKVSFLWNVRAGHLNAFEGAISVQTVESFVRFQCGGPILSGVFCEGTDGFSGDELFRAFVLTLRQRGPQHERLVMIESRPGERRPYTVRLTELQRDVYRGDIQC